MKKFLLGTTALISMSAASAALAGGSHAPAAAAPANTGGLTVMVGGEFDFQYNSKSQDLEGTNVGDAGKRNDIFRNDTKINVTAAGSTDSFDYGAVIELVGDNAKDTSATTTAQGSEVTGGDKNGDLGSRKSYLYLENDSFGRFEAGQNVGASSTLEVDASSIARATGGVDGDTLYNIVTGGTTGGTYITSPNLPTGDEETKAGNANKVTYYTPRFSGLQFGVSFTPDTGDRGSAAGVGTDSSTTDYGNVFAGGLNFESDIADGVGLQASAIYETGTAEEGVTATTDDRNDLNAYSLGLGFDFEGFSVAGNWADLGDSGQLTTATVNDESSYWSAGAAYENGPYGVSVTYLESTQGNGTAATGTANTGENEFNNIVVGADYQMAPGLVPYVEASFFEFENGSTNSAQDSSGTSVLVGANLAF